MMGVFSKQSDSITKVEICGFLIYSPGTDLGSLIGSTQCENFSIYKQLRFYVK